MRRPALTALATALAMMAATAGLGGCASDEEASARGAAERFYRALRSGQGSAACGLLAPRAAEQVRAGGDDCAKSVLRLSLPGGSVRASEVWGEEAQVRLTADTVFLHRFRQGWLVRAAGCASRGDRPYDCQVGG